MIPSQPSTNKDSGLPLLEHLMCCYSSSKNTTNLHGLISSVWQAPTVLSSNSTNAMGVYYLDFLSISLYKMSSLTIHGKKKERIVQGELANPTKARAQFSFLKKKTVSKSHYSWCYEASFVEFIDISTSRRFPGFTLFSSPCCGFA